MANVLWLKWYVHNKGNAAVISLVFFTLSYQKDKKIQTYKKT